MAFHTSGGGGSLRSRSREDLSSLPACAAFPRALFAGMAGNHQLWSSSLKPNFSWGEAEPVNVELVLSLLQRVPSGSGVGLGREHLGGTAGGFPKLSPAPCPCRGRRCQNREPEAELQGEGPGQSGISGQPGTLAGRRSRQGECRGLAQPGNGFDPVLVLLLLFLKRSSSTTACYSLLVCGACAAHPRSEAGARDEDGWKGESWDPPRGA